RNLKARMSLLGHSVGPRRARPFWVRCSFNSSHSGAHSKIKSPLAAAAVLPEPRRNYSASLLNEVPLQNVVCRQRGSRMAKAALERSGEKLAESADEIKRSSYRVEDSAERTTQLAANRTIFAAERTYAAWVRTGLVAMASGIGAKALLTGLIPQWLVTATGSVLVLFSAFCFGAAVWRHIYPGAPPPQPDVPRIPPWLLIALNSFLALVALAALMGIWFERGGPS